MSLQTSKFHGQQVINSFNLFVDTEQPNIHGNGQSKGDDFTINFGSHGIQAGDGEIIKLSLMNFNMYNNFYNIDVNSGRFNLRGKMDVGGTPTDFYEVANIAYGNYKGLKEIATAFRVAIVSKLNAIYDDLNSTSGNIFSVSSIAPKPTEDMGQGGDRMMDIRFQQASIKLTEFKIQLLASEGESYVILGGNRQDVSSSTSFNSLDISEFNNTFTIKSFYPLQRIPDPYIYLRSSQAQNGLETSVLSKSNSNNSDLLSSNILGKVFRDVEFITYNSSTGDEYFMNLNQKKISQLRLFLTDSKGRKLGRALRNGSLGTASGTGDSQNTLGNLAFTATIRIDIVKVKDPNVLETKPLMPPLPASKAQRGIITSLNVN